MYTNDIISKDYLANLGYLTKVVDQIPESKLAINIDENSWSIVNIIEHILVVEKSTLWLTQFDAENIDRSPSYKMSQIKKGLLNFDHKVLAPEVMRPSKNRSDHQSMLKELKTIRLELLKIGEEKGWNQLITKFDHPFFSSLTRLEWVYSNIYHTERHIQQIRKISHKLATIV